MNKRIFIVSIILFTFAVLTINPVFANTSYDTQNPIPDSSKIRQQLIERWFKQDLEILRFQKSEIFENEIGQRFEVRLEEYANEFAIIVAPARKTIIDVYKNGKVEIIEADSFPSGTPGSWVLFRNAKDGKPQSIRYYFHANSEIYVQFRPSDNKALSDFVVFNTFVARNVPVGMTFNEMYALSFLDMKNLTISTLPWKYAEHQSGMYSAIHQMLAIIRENLDRVEFAQDACYDENGDSIYISTEKPRPVTSDKLQLSSAGFAKWIIDGLSLPISGNCLRVSPLKKSTVTFATGSHYEAVNEISNINFALDWTRHLAAASLSLTSGKVILYSPATVDVSIFPFAYITTENGIERAPEYVKNAGYSSRILKSLFYILASTEPDYFYLGAIRQSNKKTPEVLYFNEVVAFFPWIDATGHFMVTVFESDEETSLNSFVQRHSDEYVHLVRIKASDYFRLQ